ncbi:MAG: hypothetical protein WC196_05095 [Bacilli bacterium]
MGLSRFGGLWTYANATPIVDVPEADEDAHKLTWDHESAIFRCTADGLTGGAVNVSMIGASAFHEGDVVSVVVYCDEDGENLTLVDGQFGVISI